MHTDFFKWTDRPTHTYIYTRTDTGCNRQKEGEDIFKELLNQ